jgi:RIO kinase 2
MLQIRRAANYVREIEDDDLTILKSIEWAMRRFQYVPVEQVKFYARMDKSKTQYRLDKLHKRGILQRNSQLGYVGYQLISESYDILALHSLVIKDIIVSIGDPIGRGKESDVYYGQTPQGEIVVVKIHRIGQTSFRQVRRLRNYIKNRRHISWLYVSRLSAEREYLGLQRIENLDLNSPKPIGQNRHMVVMSLIDGIELSNHPPIEHPQMILDDILHQVDILFLQGQMIHCDLCEYNLLITPQEQIRIIDFPQWEKTDHPNALSYMSRDLENIDNFFQKTYNIGFDVDALLDKYFGQDRAHLEEKLN